MKSAWFWGTNHWEQYQADYWSGREQPIEFKTSPLAGDHEFKPIWNNSNNNLIAMMNGWAVHSHKTRIIELRCHGWADVRGSYHAIIHRARDQYEIRVCHSDDIELYCALHVKANGHQPRPYSTYGHQEKWLRNGFGMLVGARDKEGYAAFAYWILYEGCAYYMSGPSVQRNVQHAVIWESLELLKNNGFQTVEMGQVDGETEKERNIGKFKSGFGGHDVPYMILRKERA